MSSISDTRILRLATRGSALALWQANRVAALVGQIDPLVQVEVVTVTTSPDRQPNAPLRELGGDKGLFVKEVEEAILEGRADAGVHSLKDMPVSDMTPGLELVCFPEREEVRDVLISRSGKGFADLDAGSVVATSALRRRGQLLRARPDLQVCEVRGNVDSRVRKLQEGQFDAMILAAAGLTRLGMLSVVTEVLSLDVMLPAAGQGAIVVQAIGDNSFADIWSRLDQPAVRACVTAEREFIHVLGADCRSAAGCFGSIHGGRLLLRGIVCSPDGKTRLYSDRDCDGRIGLAAARELAEQLLAKGAAAVLKL